ncbi:MAG: substrate-binding domain-containing protein [Robiginitomaculum sp.]|nr:substrate-binding domain-containing protein [Robiginitomaculum sp.]MDQ7076325.1 substrate-binding domain-containing protein [Robiginitomaculum sp.]
MKTRHLILAGFAVGTCALAAPALARDTLHIVGSSTVYPFSTAVAENFGAQTKYPTPIVESTGSGGGMKLFCAGVGENTPDITNASRRMKASEWKICHKNGVTQIVEVKIGYDGIVIANGIHAPAFNLTLKQVFLGLAAQIPVADDNCVLKDNPYTKWSQIDPSLPDEKIEVYGPPPTSGTRDAFVEVAMEKGAKQIACLKALRGAKPGDADYQKIVPLLPEGLGKKADGTPLAGKKIFKHIAHLLREDGAWIDAGENDNAIVQTLEKTPAALGIFGFSYLDQNGDQIKGAVVDGEEPSFENIAAGAYPISRDLFFYVKKQHTDLVPGIPEYVAEFTSEDTWGEFGYLGDKGLIPLPEEERTRIGENARALKVMTTSP